ncbi:C-type lectin domain family 4 member M-like [Betta splendens]|uniref:C-type lectin domain family 4 member M-like n=1 Tax=Betta splendens TaxID=158456 RepID=A0A6P7LHG5_BETSP|nr:C-type lectin domain family 4 member M-like [Betta splendens]
MEDIYANVVNEPSVKTRPLGMEPGPRSSERSRHGAVVLGLVLLSVLLLAGLICLGVHYHVAAAQLSTIKANVTDLMEERNQLKTNITEMQMLLKQSKTCPAGWKMFGCSCYLLSSQSGPWTDGRDDCRSRDAHLVVIDSSKEQMFLSGFTNQDAWIGLSDRDQEGNWTWIDGTPLTSTSAQFWWTNQPDNTGPTGDEDCAKIIAHITLWNDVRCDVIQQWICEKEA